MTHDNSLHSENNNVHVMSDLESCYDRHLPSIGGIVDESIGSERIFVKLMIGKIATFEHYLCKSFGISKISHGGKEHILGGTG